MTFAILGLFRRTFIKLANLSLNYWRFLRLITVPATSIVEGSHGARSILVMQSGVSSRRQRPRINLLERISGEYLRHVRTCIIMLIKMMSVVPVSSALQRRIVL